MNFPLELRFKILAIASQIAVRDASGVLLCYVKQKAFKLKEAVTVFGDEEQTRPLYTIKADRVFDISAQYNIDDMAGQPVGMIKRHGMRSFWRSHYEVQRAGHQIFDIREENPWIKVADTVFGEIPVVGILSGYLFHPAYRLTDAVSGNTVLRAEKRPAFFEGVYTIEALGAMSDDDERLGMLSILMMLLLERQRG